MTNMKTNRLIRTALALVALALFSAPALRAQPASMEQGTHQIIIEETKKVLENVSELKEQTKSFQSEFDATAARETEWSKTIQSSATSADKRKEAEARGLEAQANLVLLVNKQVGKSIGTYQQVAAGLDRIIGAAERGAMFSDQARIAQAKLAATLDDAFARDAEVYALAGSDLSKGDVPVQVTEAYRSSRKRMLAAFEAMKRMNGAFDRREFGDQMRFLRDQVQQRLVHYEMVRLLTEQQLKNIQTVAMANQLTLMGDEVTTNIEQILKKDDPLGLDSLQPGHEFDYLTTLNSTTPGTKTAQQTSGKLTRDDFARPAKF
jgi:hypothetical protein